MVSTRSGERREGKQDHYRTDSRFRHVGPEMTKQEENRNILTPAPTGCTLLGLSLPGLVCFLGRTDLSKPAARARALVVLLQ